MRWSALAFIARLNEELSLDLCRRQTSLAPSAAAGRQDLGLLSLVALWRGQAPFELKAAALATGTLLVMPYIFLYDLVILAVAMALLLRRRGNRGQTPISAGVGPTPGEMQALALPGLLIVSFPPLKAPVGFAAALVVALPIARRAGLIPAQWCASPAV